MWYDYAVAFAVVVIVLRLFRSMFWPEERIVHSPKEVAKKQLEDRH